MAGYIDAFVRSGPPSFGEMELMLTAPRRGHTCSLTWLVADGDLVTSGQALFRQQSDAEPTDERSFVSPFPARVRILQDSGRFLRPSRPVGSLHYGYALEAALRKEWQELALELAAELGRRRQAAPVPGISPRDLVKLVFLDFTLARALEKAGFRKPPPVIPADLREDRALAALEQLRRWKIAAVRTAAQHLPPDITEQTLLLWEHIFDNLAVTLRHEGLAPRNGLTPDRD